MYTYIHVHVHIGNAACSAVSPLLGEEEEEEEEEEEDLFVLTTWPLHTHTHPHTSTHTHTHTHTHINSNHVIINTIPAALVTILTWAAEPASLLRPIARAGTLTRKKEKGEKREKTQHPSKYLPGPDTIERMCSSAADMVSIYHVKTL